MGSHSPTPWRAELSDREWNAWIVSMPDRCCAKVWGWVENQSTVEANAEFIVRAVNAHDALVEALRGLKTELTTGSELTIEDWVEKADAALKLAGAL